MFSFLHLMSQITRDIIHLSESDQYNFNIQFIKEENGVAEFLLDSAPAIINTLRRVIIDETPTMAGDTCVIHQNTSVMHDEIFAHRVGLLPLNVDPRKFEFYEDNINEHNTIVFTLDVTGQRTGDSIIENVYARDLVWVPLGNQKEIFGEIRPLFEDTLLIKLAPKQQIKLELYCHKGIGKVHAKCSPVSVCFYQMLPTISIENQEVNWSNKKLKKSEVVQKAKDLCPVKIFNDLEDVQLQKCTLCRECLCDDRIRITLSDQKYLLKIEPVGWMNGCQILFEALKVLKGKAQLVIDAIAK